MGKYENELRQIINEGPWSAPNYDALDHALVSLEIALSNMSQLHTSAWSGDAGDAARLAYADAMDDYRTFRHDLETVDRIFTAATAVWQVAAQSLGSLPSTFVPQWIHDAVDNAIADGKATYTHDNRVYAVEDAINGIENLFGNHRENDAKAALASMRTDLQNLSAKLPAFVGPGPIPDWPIKDDRITDDSTELPTPTPSYHYTGGGGNGSTYPGYDPNFGGSGGGGGNGGPGDPGYNGGDPGWNDGPISVDDGSTGYLPGGSGGSGGHSGMGSLALGGGAAAAAAALRARTTGFGGSGGLNPQVTGNGGILGGGTGAGGAGGAGASGTAAGAAGGRGGMMGGGGGMGGGKSDKGKRSGLGGAIAPKLEDDPEYTPLPQGARAGRRGTPMGTDGATP